MMSSSPPALVLEAFMLPLSTVEPRPALPRGLLVELFAGFPREFAARLAVLALLVLEATFSLLFADFPF